MTVTIESLDAAGYRKFGLVSSAIVVVLFGLVIPWLFSFNYPKWPWIFAAVLGGWALLKGHIAEMQTGEGKTITAALPAITAAKIG